MATSFRAHDDAGAVAKQYWLSRPPLHCRLEGCLCSQEILGRITWSARPQASALTSIVLQVIDGVPVYADEGETGLTATGVQADCWGRDCASAKQVARALKARLSGARVTVGGVEFQAVFADSELDLFERGQGGEELYRTTMDLMVWHS